MINLGNFKNIGVILILICFTLPVSYWISLNTKICLVQ